MGCPFVQTLATATTEPEGGRHENGKYAGVIHASYLDARLDAFRAVSERAATLNPAMASSTIANNSKT